LHALCPEDFFSASTVTATPQTRMHFQPNTQARKRKFEGFIQQIRMPVRNGLGC